MLVVPLEKDVIETTDGHLFKVISYTNYKDNGPAVYARPRNSKDVVLIYFFDIDAINGTKVEYQKSSRIFRAFGKISRLFHLPQPDDKIIVLTDKISDEDLKEKVEVAGLKLKSKSLGVNKGMFVKDDAGNYYRLNQILDIERALGSEKFDREKFLEYYKDYTGG